MYCVLLFTAVVAVARASFPVTQPFYPHYPTRNVLTLDGVWDFGFSSAIADVVGLGADEARSLINSTAVVPSAFDVTISGTVGPKGTAVYRTLVPLKPGSSGQLYFAACSFYCKVFVDSVELGDHRASGYQPFWMSVPADSQRSMRELLVVSDNRFNSTTAPTHTGGDFYNFGGLTRHVMLHETPSAHAAGAKETYFMRQVEMSTVDSSSRTIDVRVVLAGNTAGVTRVTVGLTFDAEGVVPTSTKTYDVSSDGTSVFIRNLVVPNGQLWNVGAPHLHTLGVYLFQGEQPSLVDAIDIRFGIRSLGVASDGRLTINGERVKLHGVNRHTMWPATGSALTLEQVQQDVALLLELNVNYVRGAHYPQDQRFLDLCDEVGIAVWEETLGPGVKVHHLTDPYFLKYQSQAVNEMIDASFNHPSVIFHAFNNEGESDDPKACPGYNVSASIIRAREGSQRMVTWASNKKDQDKCLDLADMISFNDYPGWYKQMPLSDVIGSWKKYCDWSRVHFPTKPFSISETGAGGVWEWKNATDCKWSLLYQKELVAQDVKGFLENGNMTGLTLWQFNDIKANYGDSLKCPSCDYIPGTHDCSYIDTTCNRPGGENHKGLVDFWRRRKPVYFEVKSQYAKGGN